MLLVWGGMSDDLDTMTFLSIVWSNRSFLIVITLNVTSYTNIIHGLCFIGYMNRLSIIQVPY